MVHQAARSGGRRRVAGHAGTRGLAERAEGERISLREDDGVLTLRDPELFGPGREGFCRRLADAAIRQGARAVRISLGSGTCQIDFEPGQINPAAIAERVAEAVRSAIEPADHDGRADGSFAGWTSLVVFAKGQGKSAWEVVREERGSIRLRHRLLRRDGKIARRVARSLADQPGIESARSTFWSHDLEIQYDPERTNAFAIVGAADEVLGRILRPEADGTELATEDEPDVARGLKRVWYLALAGGSFGMTIVGFLVPGVPTVPFLLGTSYYLARSSPRLNRLLRRSWFFGPILVDYETYGGLRPINRIKLIGLTLTLGLVTLVLIGPPLLVLMLMATVTTASVYYIMRIPGIPSRARRRRESLPAPALAPA